MVAIPALPDELAAFWSGASQRLQSVLVVLSAAPVLTDDLAVRLLEALPEPPPDPRGLLRVLHGCTFVVERNSQWHLEPVARRFLLATLLARHGLARTATAAVLRFAQEADGADDPPEIPRYLLSELGLAYHTAIADPDEALDGYREAFTTASPGVAWLTGVLAEEQQELGLLPADAVLPAFYRGMTCYREGDRHAAKHYLARVARSGQAEIEVAVALHVLGVIAWRDEHRRDRAVRLLERSLQLGKELAHTYHQAQVCHTLGQLLWDNDRARAETLLERSIDVRREIGDRNGQGQVLATWADLLEKQHTADDDADAEGKAREALEADPQNPRTTGVCWRVLANVYERRGEYAKAADAVQALMETNRSLNERRYERVLARRLEALRAHAD